MQRNTAKVLCQAITACALWVCGLQMLQSAAFAQSSQDTQTEKTSKAKKAKKSASDAVSNKSAAPAPAEEKGSKTRKSKKSTEATSSGSANRAAQTGEEKHAAPAPVRNASTAEISSAKAGGKVWVNTESGVYHKGGQWYGATKQGKFMTEQEAAKAGYKPAKNEK